MAGVSFYAALSFSILVALAVPAHAYLDPGTGSILLQGLMGIVAGGLVYGRSVLRRFVARPARTGDEPRASERPASE